MSEGDQKSFETSNLVSFLQFRLPVHILQRHMRLFSVQPQNAFIRNISGKIYVNE